MKTNDSTPDSTTSTATAERPAFKSLREKIAHEKEAREARYREYVTLWDRARAAGLEAGNAHTPRPMVVVGMGQEYTIADGVCGFATVRIPRGRSSFARWGAKFAGFRKSYYGGMEYSVGEFNQSYERKLAAARAIVEVLASAGIECYAQGELD